MTLTQIQTEAREVIAKALLDGQNQIHDLRSDKATAVEIESRMFLSQEYHGTKMDELISTAYRLGKDASVDVIEQGFSESRPKTELDISELFRQARSV